MSLIPISARYLFPVYASAEDYLKRTGLYAPYNPNVRPRHWEARDVKGPFSCAPTDPNAAKAPEFFGDASLVNIPCVPRVLPWNQPTVKITKRGIDVGDPFFTTAAERDQLMLEIPGMTAAGQDPGLLDPYVYGSGETRRAYLLKDAQGRMYNAGVLLAARNKNGAWIVEAARSTTGPGYVNALVAPGTWKLGAEGWEWVPDPRLATASVIQSTLEPVTPAIRLDAGETILWNGTVALIKTIDAPTDEETLGPLSPAEKLMLSIVRDTQTRVINIERMLNLAIGSR